MEKVRVTRKERDEIHSNIQAIEEEKKLTRDTEKEKKRWRRNEVKRGKKNG